MRDLPPCVICLEPVGSRGCVACASGHATCNECLELLIGSESARAAKVDISSLGKAERATFGRLSCPCSGEVSGGCGSVFADRDVAANASTDAFAQYTQMRMLLAIHEETQRVYEEAQEALQEELGRLRNEKCDTAGPAKQSAGNVLLARQLQKTLPNARQCKECSWGPMAFRACSDLASHHGQVVARVEVDDETREVKIDNSCPRCGWFSQHRKHWPKWDGRIHDEILPNQWEGQDRAAREWYPKVAAAEKLAAERAAETRLAEERVKCAQAALDEERSAKLRAQQEYASLRSSISTTERAYAASSARVLDQLEREKGLRKKSDEARAEAMRQLLEGPPPRMAAAK